MTVRSTLSAVLNALPLVGKAKQTAGTKPDAKADAGAASLTGDTAPHGADAVVFDEYRGPMADFRTPTT